MSYNLGLNLERKTNGAFLTWVLLEKYTFQSMSHLCLPLKMQLKWTQCFRSRLSSRRYVVFIRLPVGEHWAWHTTRKKASESQWNHIFSQGPAFSPDITNSSNVFTNLIHGCFSVWAVEKENKFLIGPKQFFFLSSPVEKEIIRNLRPKSSLKRLVDLEFKIGETIWWIS